MMTLPLDKKQFFKFFLAFYFLFFSISPLTFALSDKQAPESIYATVKKSPGIKSRSLLGASRSSAEETPLTSGKAPVLVKKKRAIVPEDSSEKISLFTNASVPTDFSDPLAPTVYRLNGSPDNILEINKGFNPLYAGKSPPSA